MASFALYMNYSLRCILVLLDYAVVVIRSLCSIQQHLFDSYELLIVILQMRLPGNLYIDFY